MATDQRHLSEIFKTEYSNLVAVLCNYYGLSDLQLAEDIVSETFVRAMKTWSHKGVPDAPQAWLRKVAQNLFVEHFRRQKVFDEKIVPDIKIGLSATEPFEITTRLIEDSQLRMMFVLCDPALNKEAQVCMALRILCGFSIEEIALALLSNKEAINKKLYRAKKVIQQKKRFETELSPTEYQQRLDGVLRILYLLFNEGYYSSVNEQSIRFDICWEAMRLVLFLSRQDVFPKPATHALLALMCFHASRLEARIDGEHGDMLYDHQDKTRWNRELIAKGEQYLALASTGKVATKYHLEAAIAYWHTVENDEKWEHILQLYNRLLRVEYSPVIAMNRTYALAKANSVEEALEQAHQLNLPNNHYYYCLLAELYRMQHQLDQERMCLHKALLLARKKNEVALIKAKIAQNAT